MKNIARRACRIFLGICTLSACNSNQDVKTLSECTKSIRDFSVRISAVQDSTTLTPLFNFNYIFDVQTKLQNKKNDWKLITQFKHDDLLDSPCEDITVIDNNTAYFYIGWLYAVTTNSGVNWSVWNAETDLPGWKPTNFKLIKNVMVSKSGNGEMVLSPIRFSHNKLKTNNYGKTWVVDK